MSLKLTILGCGNSTGVPAAGDYWGQCDAHEPKNRRTRPSVLLQSNQTTLVIDTGPDFALQTTRIKLEKLDGVLYTHSHGDHVHGIDDLKLYARHMPEGLMPAYTNHETVLELKRRFYYLFEGGAETLYKPMIQIKAIDEYYGRALTIGDIQIIPFEQNHGHVNSVGYRFGSCAYSTDVKKLDSAALETLKGIKTWIIDGAGYHQDNNPVHANLKEIYAMNEIIQAPQVYLTSLSLVMDYQTLRKELPNGYLPLYDGMTLDISSSE